MGELDCVKHRFEKEYGYDTRFFKVRGALPWGRLYLVETYRCVCGAFRYKKIRAYD